MMKIKELIDKPYANAVERGFYDKQNSVIGKMRALSCFTEEDIEYVKLLHKVTKIMLIVTELSEEVENLRLGKPEGEEIGDTVVRIGDYCGRENIDLDGQLEHVMKTNKERPRLHGGKKF